MNILFLDTVGLVALWDQTDQWHAPAAAALARVDAVRTRLLTTTYVLAECGNAAARRPYRPLVDQLRETLEASDQLVSPTSEDWSTAWGNYRFDRQGGAGFVDHLSFAVMRRLGIEMAFTNDRHFKSNGFEVLF